MAGSTRIFISHSHFDNPFCQLLRDFLRQHIADVDIFYDEQELHGGDEWLQRIQREVLTRPLFILVLSRQSIIAPWVGEETRLALSRTIRDQNRRIIPVQIEQTISLDDVDQLAPLLTLRQILYLGTDAPQSSWNDLLRVIRGEITNMASQIDPAQLANLEHARDFAAQTHDAYLAAQWRNAARLGSFAVTLPGNENDPTLWGELGTALVRSGNNSEGLRDLDKALDLNRGRGDFWRVKGEALQRQGALNDALRAWDMALVTTRASALKLEILALQCEVLQQARHWDSVIEVADEALSLDEANTHFRAVRADAQTHLASLEHFPAYLRDLGFYSRIINEQEIIMPPLCEIPAGPFIIGSAKDRDPEAYNDELPQHQVNLAAFRIAKYPVTVAEYACAVRAGAVRQPPEAGYVNWQVQLGQLHHPAVYISWHDAMDYARWLSECTGEPWRLPTEAEWEKAARGLDARIYPWSNEWDDTRANTLTSGRGGTQPVGSNAHWPSPYGVQDMIGNIWEWCSSLYRPYPFDAADGREDMADAANSRVLRGASWSSEKRLARAAFRYNFFPVYLDNDRGFRLAHDE